LEGLAKVAVLGIRLLKCFQEMRCAFLHQN
jgi:hypothetical protein